MATKLPDISQLGAAKIPAGTVHWFHECLKRGQGEIFSEVITVTPAFAKVLLSNNPDNRHIRPLKVAKFAADMQFGRWSLNGEPIIVAKTGEINDGQHRGAAIIEANVALPMVLTFGVERETRTTVDQGSARTAADFLSMSGVPHAAIAASMTRLIMAFERSGGRDIAGTKLVTSAEVLERVETDPEIIESAQFAQKCAKFTQSFCAPSAFAAAHYLLSGVHDSEADAFMEQVGFGENLEKKDPAFSVRLRLATTGKYPGQKLEVIFRGWNAYRSGRSLTFIPVHGRFPELV